MRAITIILRIIANVSAFPVLIFFFYFILQALGSHDAGLRRFLNYLWPFSFFFFPVIVNMAARYLGRNYGKRP